MVAIEALRVGIPAILLTGALSPFAALAQDTHLARNLAATCASCHGTNGQALGDMKPLAGMPAQQIMAAFAEFKRGARTATVMHQIARGYTEAQIGLIAGYFATQSATH